MPMAEAFIQPVCEIVRCLWAPISKRINYARKLSKNFIELNEKVSRLSTRRDDINVQIEQLKLQKTPTKECETWKTKVAEMENEVENTKKELNVEKKCVGGICCDFFAYVKLGERVVNVTGEVNELLERSKFENGFLTDLPPAQVEKQPDPDSNLTNSADFTLKKVQNSIRNNSTPKIGIYGMGGVGKTTVLQLLNNSSEIAAMFDFVIWITVSKSFSIKRLQNEIGRRLQVEISADESHDSIISKLRRKLEGKKYLLLLDDVWEELNLSDVGLPNANQNNGCKVVLTTRKLEVCGKMGTNIDIKVEVLRENEAQELFFSNVLDVIEKYPSIKILAKEIVRECAGLPLALKIVSSALRKVKNENVWRNFLRKLKSPATSFIKELNDKVFKPLKVSYDQLDDPEIKKCFLYCGLYPEDFEIPKFELIMYWRAEGLLSSKLNLKEAYAEGDCIVQALLDSSLLERCKEDDRVKLHDVVRDLVLAMTSLKGEEGTIHLVRAGSVTEKMPEDEEWTKATRISFMDYDHELCNLPESPDCPVLLSLLLKKFQLEVIPESFFKNMPCLRVLDLSFTKIKLLPTSISNLISLRQLLLRDCDDLEFIPDGVIRSLSWMEEFKCYGYGLRIESVDIITEELSSMDELSSLEFNFRTTSNLQSFLEKSRSWREGKLTNFEIIVEEWRGFFEADRTNTNVLKYDGRREKGGGRIVFPWAIKEALSRSNMFVLQNYDDDGELNTLSEVGAYLNNCEELKELVLDDGYKAVENVTDKNGIENDAFSKLESLQVGRLDNLRCMVDLSISLDQQLQKQKQKEKWGPTPQHYSPVPSLTSKSFTNLRDLTMYKCIRMERVFSISTSSSSSSSVLFIIQLLSNLESLDIRHCDRLEGMISEDEKIKVDDVGEGQYYYEALPKLSRVYLLDLLEFVSFFKGVPMRWPSLKEVQIYNCPKLIELPDEFNNRTDIQIIRRDY